MRDLIKHNNSRIDNKEQDPGGFYSPMFFSNFKQIRVDP